MDNTSLTLKLGPSESKKPRFDINNDKCIICNLSSNENLTLATQSGVESLFEAAKLRQDYVLQNLNAFKEGIDTSEFDKGLYHRSCFKRYTSKHNLEALVKTELDDKTTEQMSLVSGLEYKPLDTSVCFICKKITHKKVKTVHKLTTADRLSKIKEKAIELDDHEIIFRAKNESLLDNAVYHAACLINYLNKKQTKTKSQVHDIAFKELVKILDTEILSGKKCLSLSAILKMFQSFLPEDIRESYNNSSKLKIKIEKHYKGAIVILPQQGQGKSSLVFSSEISVGDAVKAANQMKAVLEMSQMEYELSTACSSSVGNNQQQILYSAASILRQEIEKMYICSEYYPAYDEVSLDMSEALLPNSLMNFITWLLDRTSFDSMYTFPDTLPDDVRRKRCAIAECFVSNITDIITPFSLGLSVQLYHEFGSKVLIECLSSHGFCVTYDELRRFLTSVASAEISTLKKGNCYVPSEISKFGSIVQEGVDNIDINTETIDGKNTFHSMARAIFQNTVLPGSFGFSVRSRYKREQGKSLSFDDHASSLMQCLPFKKPTVRGEPPRRERAMDMINSCRDHKGPVPDIVWVFLRMLTRDGVSLPRPLSVKPIAQCVPFWSGYFSSLSPLKVDRTIVAYGPIIDNKPSDMSTVYTAMKNCKDLALHVGQKHSVQTMDQQLYAVAQQVKWSLKDQFSDHILRLGGFHALSCFVASVGKLWTDAGLRDLLVDSGVYASATVEQMLSGKQFNRAVRGLSLVYEALTHVLLSEFFKWCLDGDQLANVPNELWKMLKNAHSQFENSNEDPPQQNDNLYEMFASHIFPLMTDFLDEAAEKSPTFKFWRMLLQALQILLQNIKAEREGDWDLHLFTVSKMLPYFFVANRTNYSRWAPVYLLDMIELPQDVKRYFDEGEFAIRQVSGKYNGIWSDMAVEKTVIKDSKGSGGITNITRQKSALIRWSLTRHVLADFSSIMRKRSGLKTDAIHEHEQNRKSAIKRDEEHVMELIRHIQERMTNPFDVSDHPSTLINISTGMHASSDVQTSLLTAIETGSKQLKSFVNGALSSEGKVSFYSSLTRSNLKTFADMSKKTQLRCRTGQTLNVHMDPELVFRRALTLSSVREDVSLKTIMEHPIGPVPTSLFHDDGTMRKSVKAELLHRIEDLVTSAPVLPVFDKSATVLIRDGMALVQGMFVKKGCTFGDLVNDYIRKALSCFPWCGTLVDVFDRYDLPQSVKSSERERRQSKSGSVGLFHVIEGRTVPDWKKFLGLSDNKRAFLSFLGDSISAKVNEQFQLSFPSALYLAGCFSVPEKVKKVTEGGVIDCPHLYCDHEEADTRMIFHAFHIDSMFRFKDVKGRIVIKSDDTDVLALAVYFFPKLSYTKELWIQTGSLGTVKDNRRFIPVHSIVSALNPTVVKVLPFVHALTGCDSTSAFFGIGKKSVFKALTSFPELFSDLYLLSERDVETAVDAARVVVAKLYDYKDKFKRSHGDLNSLRLQLATSKDKSLVKLPPCEASFKQHVLRSMWQSRVWATANIAKPRNGKACDYGWQVVNNNLEPVLFEGQMASDFIQDLICSCRGKKACQLTCVCREQGLSCTDLCFCQNGEVCNNTGSIFSEGTDENDEME